MKTGWYLFFGDLCHVRCKGIATLRIFTLRGEVKEDIHCNGVFKLIEPYPYFLNHSNPTIEELQVMPLVDKDKYDIYLTIKKELDRLGVVE